MFVTKEHLKIVFLMTKSKIFSSSQNSQKTFFVTSKQKQDFLLRNNEYVHFVTEKCCYLKGLCEKKSISFVTKTNLILS